MSDDLKMSLYEHDGARLFVRQGHYETWDKGIVQEVAAGYFWNELEWALEGDVRVLDVGAHIGSFSAYAARRWPDAEIIALEADRENWQVLEFNAGLIAGITPYYARLGYSVGEYVVARSRENSGGHIVVEAGQPIGNAYVVEPFRGDVFTIERVMQLHGWDAIDLLKLDCEGCEIEALDRISDDALARIRHIVGERHISEAEFRQGAGARLATAGFAVEYRNSSVDELGTFYARRE